mmetsp:Transcript_606/g.1988  ORF Transcript_606/g.1988 Transcript_606/m.1988 type:complete len:238 (-) Transcript_606:26-739(-)
MMREDRGAAADVTREDHSAERINDATRREDAPALRALLDGASPFLLELALLVSAEVGWVEGLEVAAAAGGDGRHEARERARVAVEHGQGLADDLLAGVAAQSRPGRVHVEHLVGRLRGRDDERLGHVVEGRVEGVEGAPPRRPRGGFGRRSGRLRGPDEGAPGRRARREAHGREGRLGRQGLRVVVEVAGAPGLEGRADAQGRRRGEGPRREVRRRRELAHAGRRGHCLWHGAAARR